MVESTPLFPAHQAYEAIRAQRTQELADIMRQAPDMLHMKFAAITPKGRAGLSAMADDYIAWRRGVQDDLSGLFRKSEFWQTDTRRAMEAQYQLDLSKEADFIKLYTSDIIAGALMASASSTAPEAQEAALTKLQKIQQVVRKRCGELNKTGAMASDKGTGR